MDANHTYFALLRAALYGETAPCETSVDAETLTLAQRQGTAALIYDRLLSLPADKRPDANTQAFMKHMCARNMMHQEHMLTVLHRAMTALESLPSHAVLMKGFTLARLYPKPYLRQCGDIDIFVGKEAYHDGARLLREAFPEAALFDEEKDYYKHYNLTLKNTAVEMHRVSVAFMHPRDAKHYDRLEHEAMFVSPRKVTTEYGTWFEPEERFNILFVFLHSWEHFVTETASLRQLCDLALALHAVQDTAALTSYLRPNLKKLRLLRAWQLYAYILVNYLGLPQDKTPLYTPHARQRAEKLLSIILYPQPKEKAEHNAPKNVILRKLYTFIIRLREARDIAKVEPRFAIHTVFANIAQSWSRFLRGENTRTWE